MSDEGDSSARRAADAEDEHEDMMEQAAEQLEREQSEHQRQLDQAAGHNEEGEQHEQEEQAHAEAEAVEGEGEQQQHEAEQPAAAAVGDTFEGQGEGGHETHESPAAEAYSAPSVSFAPDITFNDTAAASAGDEAKSDEHDRFAASTLTPIVAEDLTGLTGVALLQAQSRHEYALKLRAIELRLAEEEELDRRALEDARAKALMSKRADVESRRSSAIRGEDDASLSYSAIHAPAPLASLLRAEGVADALSHLIAAERDHPLSRAPDMDDIEGDALVIDSIDLEEVRVAEGEIEAKRVEKVREDQAHFLSRLESLRARENTVRARAEADHALSLADVDLRRSLLSRSSSAWREGQAAAFKRAEEYLVATVETQKKTLRSVYGTLAPSKPVWSDGRAREEARSSDPRLLALRVDCLRAVKNKLPGGHYVVVVTLYDRLGGHPLRGCSLPVSSSATSSESGSAPVHWAMTPQPQRHGGKFYNLELCFAQSQNLLALACPSLSSARPGNNVLFEVVRVRSARVKEDRVEAWGVFPLHTGSGALVDGKFKLPLLRGTPDPTLDKFEQLQHRVAQDVDHWLCNLYFTARPVAMRVNRTWWGGVKSVGFKIDQTMFPPFAGAAGAGGAKGRGGAASGSGYSYGRDSSAASSADDAPSASTTGPVRLSTPTLPLGGGKVGSGGAGGEELNPFLPAKYRKQAAAAAESSGAAGGTDDYILPSDLAAGAATDLARRIAARERAKELRGYNFSLTRPEADLPLDAFKTKMTFILSHVTSDLSGSRAGTMEFWSTLGLLVLAWWLRIWVHYFGQYLWLTWSSSNPESVYSFEVQAWTVRVKYTLDPLSAVLTESLVLLVGVASNQIALLGMIVLSWGLTRLLGTFSDAGYRFLLAYGLNVLLDPVFIALVDAFDRYGDGDYFKLYNVYAASEYGIGYAGAFLTITIALILMCISFVIVFTYVTKLHMNGRMLDVYHRLHSDEGQFFVPNDLELSVRTLKYILGKSKKWTGFHGTRRKVLLTAYLIDDHQDRSFHDRTLHLSIYNVTPKMGKRPEQRDIFRHFIRTSDGAIIEAFDAVESMGAEGYQRLEERWLATEASSIDDQEAAAEDLMKHMLSDQKRAEAEKAGSRPRTAKSLTPSDGSEPSVSRHGLGGGGMSIVQELSQERSEIDDEEPQHEEDNQHMAHIGEDEEEEAEDED